MAPTPETSPIKPTSPEIIDKFTEILKSNGIIDPVSEIIVKDSGLKGENMCSKTEYVTVKFEDPNKSPLYLFTKKPTPNAEYNKMLEDLKFFEKEAVFCMEYLPVAREYCKRLGHEELMNIYPKCYYGDDKLIVLENLVLGKGYILLNKEEPQDFETAKFALENLSKHHAISYAVIKEAGPESFFKSFPTLKFEAFMSDCTRTMITPGFDSSIDTNVKILENCDIEGGQKAVEILKSLKGKQFDAILEALTITPDDNILVLNHGDYWNNNMMFLKDKETNKVMDPIAIDFQLVRYASPSVDLAYYLFTSVKAQVRRERFRELLTLYLDSLKITSKQLGHPIELSLPELEADLCNRFHLGFWFGLVVTTGPGFAVSKDLEITETDGMAEMNAKYYRLIAKWIEDNPEKSKVSARNIVEYVREYERFVNSIIA